MKDDELAAIEARVRSTTPGPWYPIITDDALYQGAVYVGRTPRGRMNDLGFYLDDGRGAKLLVEDQINDEDVVAITCLQSPRVVYQDACDDNALFIAHARDDVTTLLAEVRRLRALVSEQL